MKPKNFPERKNARRCRAAVRLNEFQASVVFDDRRLKIANRERSVLTARIVTPDMARAIRTKKDRSARGKFRVA